MRNSWSYLHVRISLFLKTNWVKTRQIPRCEGCQRCPDVSGRTLYLDLIGPGVRRRVVLDRVGLEAQRWPLPLVELRNGTAR
jgi:hypothetical protein